MIGYRRLSRRVFLGGACAALALPLLESALPRSVARAQATPPARFLGYYVPCGIRMEHWTPKSRGRRLRPAADPRAAAQPIKSKVCVLTGLANKPAQARRPGRSRLGHGRVPDLRAPVQDRGRRHPERHLARPAPRGSARRRHLAALAAARHRRRQQRRRLRLGLQLRVRAQHLVVGPGDAAAQAGRPGDGVRSAVRRLRSRGHARAGRAPAAPEQERARLRARRRERARRAAGHARPQASSTST